MYVYYDNNGKIMCMIHASEPFADNEIPINHGTPLYLDDTQYADVWINAGEYTIQNSVPVYTPIPDSVKLANAQSAKEQQLIQSYFASLQTFQSSALGAAHTYYADERSMTFLASEYAFVRSSDYDQSTINWLTQDAGKLTHTGAQIAQVFLDGRAYVKNQDAKLDGLITNVKAATTIDAVNAINW